MELVVTQVWPERNPCCIVFAFIARAYLVWTKDFRKEPQGNIDGFWRGAKKAIPDSLPLKKHGKRNVNIWTYFGRYQQRWEPTGKNLMKLTAATLKTMRNRQNLLGAFFDHKCCEGAKQKLC